MSGPFDPNENGAGEGGVPWIGVQLVDRDARIQGDPAGFSRMIALPPRTTTRSRPNAFTRGASRASRGITIWFFEENVAIPGAAAARSG